MNKHQVSMHRVDNGNAYVLAENEDEAVEKAFEAMPFLCAQCAGMGYGSKASVDEGEWELDEDLTYKDYDGNFTELKAVKLVKEDATEDDLKD